MIRGHFQMPGQEPLWPLYALWAWRVALLAELAYIAWRLTPS